MTPRDTRSESGFSLPEVMVAMGIMLFVLAGTFTAMNNAMLSERTAREVTTLNGNLRASMDLMVRDLLQVGQGLPVGRRVGVPNGPGSVAITRPGPPASGGCPGVGQFPVGPSLPAVNVGPGFGPPINGQCTDVITTIAADGAFENVNVSSVAADGRSLTIYPGGPDGIVGNGDDVIINDNPDVRGDNIRIGDLLMISKGATSTLVAVTNVGGQVVTINPGDPLSLNQFDPGLNMLGTMNQSKAQAPVDPDNPVLVAGVVQPGASVATRVRMITYFIDIATDPTSPRLMRAIGGAPANAVGFEVEAFQITYDIADGVLNPTNVRMVAADLAGAGACNDPGTPGGESCSENQVRKTNIVLAMRSRTRNQQTNDFYHNTLFTQVALRSLAFVDRY